MERVLDFLKNATTIQLQLNGIPESKSIRRTQLVHRDSPGYNNQKFGRKIRHIRWCLLP